MCTARQCSQNWVRVEMPSVMQWISPAEIIPLSDAERPCGGLKEDVDGVQRWSQSRKKGRVRATGAVSENA